MAHGVGYLNTKGSKRGRVASSGALEESERLAIDRGLELAIEAVRRGARNGSGPAAREGGTSSGVRRALVRAVRHHTEVARDLLAELAQARDDALELLEGLPYGIALERESRIVHANRALVRALGFECARRLEGKRLLDLLEPQAREALRARDRWALVRMPPGRFRFERADGQSAELEVVPIGQVWFRGARASVLLVRDLSEQIEIERRLMRHDRLRALGLLSGSIVHEINNPLTLVLGHLELHRRQLAELREGENAVQEGDAAAFARRVAALERGAELIEEGARRIGEVARAVLALARGGSGRLRPVRLEEPIALVRNLVSRRPLGAARLEVELGTTPPVEADPDRLVQVLLNLVLNAAQAMDRAGVERGRITINTSVTAERAVLLRVCDDGPGMTEAVRARALEPFFTTREEGSGLGLSLCRAIVRSMGAELEIESAPGEGTEVRIRFERSGGRA